MGNFIYGTDGNIKLNINDDVLRALQEAVVGRISKGEVLHLAFTGKQNGRAATSALILSSSIPMMFTYELEKLPEINKSLVTGFNGLIDETGGLDLSGLGSPAKS
ncbi:hypothetical protein [Arthrobacter sp. ES3-54]|uniref:DUF7882 family protein n=1 Tax=Arthrobacter sp. ES3-54 TaxID=1502991 RepID=UPI002407114C|nr:hypothetical protein [Arthrobacter sp. ES3-54]MDF9751385.1 hypothetical protein [Arthrobacter sp. ES3-54]